MKRLKTQQPTDTKIVEKPVLTKKQVDDLSMVASKLDLLGRQLSNVALDTGRILEVFDESQRSEFQWSKENRKRLQVPTVALANGEPPPPRRQHHGSGEPPTGPTPSKSPSRGARARHHRGQDRDQPVRAASRLKENIMVKKIKKATKTKAVKTASRKGHRGGSVGGGHRKCGVCGKLGHNRRSHESGRLK